MALGWSGQMPKPTVRVFRTKTMPDEFWDSSLRQAALWIPTPNPHGLRAVLYDSTKMRHSDDWKNEKLERPVHPFHLLTHG